MKKGFLLAVLCAVLVIFCIGFVDRPVERIVHAHRHFRFVFQLMAVPSLVPLPVSAVVLAVAIWRRLFGVKALPDAVPDKRMWLMFSVATLASTALKDELKWMFGRPWPNVWVKYGFYGFHPFDTLWLFGCFPSGHTAYIAAPMCVLWAMVPRYRALWASVTLLVMVGLVGAGYHYVGDVIAGFFTGLAAASGTLVLMREAKIA